MVLDGHLVKLMVIDACQHRTILLPDEKVLVFPKGTHSVGYITSQSNPATVVLVPLTLVCSCNKGILSQELTLLSVLWKNISLISVVILGFP